MKTKKQEKTEFVPLANVERMQEIGIKIYAEGFLPYSEMVAQFGEQDATRAIAILFRNFRVIREVRRPWGKEENILGYEWADRRFSNPEAAKLPVEYQWLKDMKASRIPKYESFEHVKVRCQWVNSVVGGLPMQDDDGAFNGFLRGNGKADILIIPAYCLRSMFAKVLPMIGKEVAIARRIGWKRVEVKPRKLDFIPLPKVDESKGKSGGLGVHRHERFLAGEEFIVDAMVPTSHLSIAEFIAGLRKAGDYVRFSPGRSAGFGDFEVMEIITD